MAILGVQLVLTMIMLSFLHKLSSHFSIARWILTKGLIRYLHPSDESLRELIGLPKRTFSKNRKRKEQNSQDDTKFNVPRNITLQLEPREIKLIDIITLPFYTEFQWLVDFSFCASIIYILTEIYYFVVPNTNEFNLSLIWCGLVIAFSMKILYSVTAIYFRGDESIGERSMCLVSGCVFFLLAMIVLIINEEFLEFGLESAYLSFNNTAYQMLQFHNASELAYGPASFLMFKFWLAVWCGFIGAFFTFPGLRFAQMHKDALQYAEGNYFVEALLNLNFVSPFFIVLMWVKPLARNYFTVKNWTHSGIIMSETSFESFRILLIVFIIIFRIAFIRKYLQSYLNIAPQKIQLIKKEAGKITNLDLQKMVARVTYYLCVVALQFITPILMCLFMTLLMKNLSNYSWTSSSYPSVKSDSFAQSTYTNDSYSNFTIEMLRNVFNPTVFKGLTGFMVWWLCNVSFCTSAIGFLYHTYFTT